MSSNPLFRSINSSMINHSSSVPAEIRKHFSTSAASVSNPPTINSGATNLSGYPFTTLTDTTSRNLRAVFDALDLQADDVVAVEHINQIIPVVFNDNPPSQHTLDHVLRMSCELSDQEDLPDTLTFPQFVNFFISLDEELIRNADGVSADSKLPDADDDSPSASRGGPGHDAKAMSTVKSRKHTHPAPKKEDDPFDMFHFDMSNIDNIFRMLSSTNETVTSSQLHDTLNSLGFQISHDEASAMVDLAAASRDAQSFNRRHFHNLVRTLRSTISYPDEASDKDTNESHNNDD